MNKEEEGWKLQGLGGLSFMILRAMSSIISVMTRAPGVGLLRTIGMGPSMMIMGHSNII